MNLAREAPSEFVGVTEAARILNCSWESVRLYAKQGILPSLKVGGSNQRIYRRVDVEALARARAKR